MIFQMFEGKCSIMNDSFASELYLSNSCVFEGEINHMSQQLHKEGKITLNTPRYEIIYAVYKPY
jgi:hypothetical protein